MPVKGVKTCGARCRTKGGAPCLQPGMKNGRCKVHGGHFHKREVHGLETVRARAARRQERAFLKEMKDLNKSIDEVLNEG